jgi:gluconolactonase
VLDQVMLGDPMVTNVCFGGDDLRTAYATLSGSGRLVSIPWPRPGLKLNY